MYNKRKMKIVYITGCLGFIGSHLTRSVLKLGWQVFGIDKCSYASQEILITEFEQYKNFKFLKKDINELDRVYECDYFINVAAETHVGNSIVKSEEFIKSNILGVYNILNLIKNSTIDTDKMPTLLQFSTDEVYGDIIEGKNDENSPLKPSNPYSATKASADMLILAWSKTYKIPYVIIRPTNNYGTGQYIEKLIPRLCKYIQINKKMPLMADGLSIRSWLHVSDTVSAVVKIIENNCKNEIFNITSKSEYNIRHVCDQIIKNFYPEIQNTDIFYSFDYQRPGHDLRYSLNDEKIRNLGWTDCADFDLELKKIASYYKDKYIW